MIKKGLTQQDLADLLNKQEGMNVRDGREGKVTKHRVSYWINGTERISPLMAKRIELALDLKEGSIPRITGLKRSNTVGYDKVFGEKEDSIDTGEEQ